MSEYVPSDNVSPPEPQARLASLDAYRGFIMLCMVSGGLGISRVAQTLTEDGTPSKFWDFLAFQCSHVEWTGCAFWDLIQPSFMFMVGVAMPFSFAKRCAVGHTRLQRGTHVLYRALALTLLGVFLSSNWATETNWTFANVLCQIGLGYAFVYLILRREFREQAITVGVVLLVYWAFFAFWPLPAPGYDYAKVGIGENGDRLQGFFAHWDKNANPAHYFDLWFLNRFARSEPFTYNTGGYQTLNFVPSIATMLFGVMAGKLLRSQRPPMQKFKTLLVAGAAGLVLGWLLGQSVCPIVKRIWTPTWAVFSTGWACLFLAAFFYVIDIKGHKRWAFPFVVVGMNSIAMYMMAQLIKGWVRKTLNTHLPSGTFGGAHGPLFEALLVLLVLWLITFWLYRRKIFLKI